MALEELGCRGQNLSRESLVPERQPVPELSPEPTPRPHCQACEQSGQHGKCLCSYHQDLGLGPVSAQNSKYSQLLCHRLQEHNSSIGLADQGHPGLKLSGG